MADPFAILNTIKQQEAALRTALGAEATDFFAGRDALFAASLAAETQADQDRAATELRQLVQSVPAAARILSAADPSTFGATPAATAATSPPAASINATAHGSATPAITNGADATLEATRPAATTFTPRDAAASPIRQRLEPLPSAGDSVPPKGTAGAASARPALPPVPPPGSGERMLTSAPSARAAAAPDAFEQRVAWLKESVAAGLGILLVGGTVIMGAITMFRSAADFDHAKDVLLLLSSLSGVVLGYYFGRIPSDARAAQAQHTADAALSETAAAKVEAREIAAEATEIAHEAIGLPAAEGTRSRAVVPSGNSDLEGRLRDLERRARRL